MMDSPIAGVPYDRLDPAEKIAVQAAADEGVVIVTDRRILVTLNTGRFDLDIPFGALRRVQFDIERHRPATLVIVPELPSDRPIVLAVPPEQYAAVATTLAVLGRTLHEVPPGASDQVSEEAATG